MSDLTPESVREQIAGIAAPLREQLREVDSALETKLEELKQLRETRAELQRILRTLDPETRPGPKKKREGTADYRREFSEEMLGQIREWLQFNAPELNAGEGFYAAQLSGLAGAPTGQARLNKAVVLLHHEGILRLDHTNGHKKFFKVVS